MKNAAYLPHPAAFLHPSLAGSHSRHNYPEIECTRSLMGIASIAVIPVMPDDHRPRNQEYSPVSHHRRTFGFLFKTKRVLPISVPDSLCPVLLTGQGWFRTQSVLINV